MTRGLAPSFDRVVTEHQSAVVRVCRSILRDEHLGADAAQEVFLKLWRRLCDQAPPVHVAGWLRKVAVSTSLDLARRRRVREDAQDHVRAASRAGQIQDTRRPDQGAAAAELAARFEDAVAHLSEGQRTVFLLRHSGGMSLPEVAASLGVAVPTVKTQFARACLRLQTRLSAYRPGEGEDR